MDTALGAPEDGSWSLDPLHFTESTGTGPVVALCSHNLNNNQHVSQHKEEEDIEQIEQMRKEDIEQKYLF